jgi:hypothetical protein
VTLRIRNKRIHILLYNLPVGTLSSVLKILILLKYCVKILFSNTFMRKGKDPDLDPDPYL